MKSKQTLIILNSKPGDQSQLQIISAAKSKGYEVMSLCKDNTYLFVPDDTNSDQIGRGVITVVNNETDQELISKGFKHNVNALSKDAIALIGSDVIPGATNNDQHTSTDVNWDAINNLESHKQSGFKFGDMHTETDEVNWEVMNNLPHMQAASNI